MEKKATQLPDFEQSINELEKIVEKMEGGNLPLEEDLKLFEQGISLTRHCQKALKTAQQRVQILLDKNTFETGTFSQTDEDNPLS